MTPTLIFLIFSQSVSIVYVLINNVIQSRTIIFIILTCSACSCISPRKCFESSLESRNSHLSIVYTCVFFLRHFVANVTTLFSVPADIYYVAPCTRRDEVLVEKQPSRAHQSSSGDHPWNSKLLPRSATLHPRNIADLITRGSENPRNGHRVCGQRLSTSNGRVFVLPPAIKTATGSNLREEVDRLQTRVATGKIALS
jgi:hypothetical protein